jgi:undecaprenyl-diphosphatase
MLNYFILGAIQGIFEWIPVSSEGVVALMSQFLVKEFNPIDLALFLHFGTLLAVLVYFRKDWKEVITLKNKKLLKFLIIATIFSLIIGYPFYKLIHNVAVGSTLLVIMGMGLLLTAYFQRKKKKLEIGPDKLAALAGFFQGLAVIPGLSRSGATIFSLSLGKSDPAEILKLSYMMSAPAVLASSGYLFLENPILASQTWPALIFSFLVGFLSLHFLITLANKINFFKFALIFGLLCLFGAII